MKFGLKLLCNNPSTIIIDVYNGNDLIRLEQLKCKESNLIPMYGGLLLNTRTFLFIDHSLKMANISNSVRT
jgi:hypothetical protein